jgi:hypothetical protein
MIERINKIKKIPSNIWFVLCRIVNLCDIQVHNLGIYNSVHGYRMWLFSNNGSNACIKSKGQIKI